MKTRLATSLISLALAALAAGSSSAQGSLVAGWDFSQYAGDGFMSIDGGSSFTNTLSANYSDLDPTFGAGFDSAAFGTMYANGDFGSTPVAAGSGNEEFVPSAAVGGSLLSNLDAPSLVDFDAFTVLSSEGQVSAESLAMIAPSAASVVFEADLSGMSQTGSNWVLSFGGRTFSGTSSVAIEFSSDGTSFASFGSANLTAVDSKFTVALGTASSDLAYVRLTFSPVGVDQPLIDNLAISADLSAPPTTTTTTTTSTTVPTTTTTSTSTSVPGSTTTSTSTSVPGSTTTSTSTSVPGSTTTSTSTSVPGSTTTSTSTSVPGSTTTSTSTSVPGSTTTSTSTSVPGSTTTSTSTTGPASTTTSTSTSVPGSTTTTTTLPSGGDLSGQYSFADKSTGDANTNFLNVDTGSGQVCVAGQTQEFDQTATPFNRSVTFTYRSTGTIIKATDKKVRADFTSVSLTLEIVDLVPGAPVQEYNQTITTECKLKASLQKEGTRDRVSLRCSLGENFSDFPGLTSELVENVANASLKGVKVNTKKGRLKISTSGVPTDAVLPISCGLGT